MGIDALDICFRSEKEFGLGKVTREWPATGRLYDGRPDVTAGEVAALVTRLLGRGGAEPPAPSPDDLPTDAVAAGGSAGAGLPTLGYESRVGGPWPPPPAFDPAVWPGVCRVLAAALGADPAGIVPQSRLIADLGMC